MSIGEPDPANPIDLTRAECLEFINYAYQVEIGEKLNMLKLYEYDGSDAAHTITAGVGTLPSDFLAVYRVYDGDPDDVRPLEQITDIEDKVDDTDTTKQYMIPDEATLWIFGQTPTNTIRLYYKAQPTVLTDDVSSSPIYLKPKFHIAFIAYIKMLYADRMDNLNDYFAKKSEWLDVLDNIEYEHNHGRQDAQPKGELDVYGGLA
jgi:hypothetical protein